MNPEYFFNEIAAALDPYAEAADSALWELVSHVGACMADDPNNELPDFTSDDMGERLTALRICAGCPVQWECLELDLRVSGVDTAGVWGGFGPEDRSAVHEFWVTRGTRVAAPDQSTSDLRTEEGGERT